MPRVYKFLDPVKRLQEKSIPVTESGCLIWMGLLNSMGYGRLQVNGKSQYAHRVSYELKNGKIPKGLFVLHKCDVPTCINPDHLFLGDQADNIADMIAKGRGVRGEKVHNSKLTEKDVLAIRASPVGVNELARRMGLAPMTISLIRNRKIWKHVQ